MLQINKLSLIKKRQGQKRMILQEISVEIPSKKITVLLGKSGSGKTSLLRSIAQLEKDYDGNMTYRKNSLNALSTKNRCQVIGFVPQLFGLFPHMNVLNNCAYPLANLLSKKPVAVKQEVENVLKSLDMDKYSQCYPHELSGGQQQRVAIARALVLNPTFLLFDEPTSALDPENTEKLIKIIRKLKEEGKGLIISSQDMDFAKNVFDLVIFLEEGKIVEQYDLFEGKTFSSKSKLWKFFHGFSTIKQE